MERQPPEEVEKYRIFFHSHCSGDLNKIHPEIAAKILETIKVRLSVFPQYAGSPLKGCKKLIYKLRFSKYRVLYTFISVSKEVWILAIEPRTDIYREENIETLLRIGIALHKNLTPSQVPKK